ncbi:hypothetical protein PSU4_35220 [Pseudonocardia sulfidoxydans NBRC 16205]|uniref:Asp23/Gls24 family envelope stress response protein n=1 Tax=Pseudonocardia sulfidoxydans NBRC 16205 TaxID=1223511 RepID=A0A511DNE3_9PSEU|nr:Asp23/Gls24 family envelope stress response protein [Pseudonocardia sulfidoxydans]GEL24568.1 hypothetical protein PSU4_35220 [Pseudonocardia sulfidoxydans NBRC 16205]
MSAGVDLAKASPPDPAADPAADAEIAGRGRLEIAPSVLRKIVEYNADQVPGTLRTERRVAGFDVGDAGSAAKVSVGGPAGDVDVRLELALQYPGSVRRVVDQVRGLVAEELTRLTGYRLRSLAVTVTGLRGLPPPPRLR